MFPCGCKSLAGQELDLLLDKTMKRFVILTVAALFLFSRGIWAEDDFQYWQRLQLKVIDTKYFDYTTYGELRFAEDASDLHLWQTSQKFQFDPPSIT